MRKKDLSQRACPIARALDVVGEWWALLVVRDALLGHTKFEEFRESLDIARNILTARLKTLTERGVLERRRYQQAPDRYEYVLTEKGRALGPVVLALAHWGNRWEGEGRAPVRMVDQETGDEVEQVLVSARTGKRVSGKRVLPVPAPHPLVPRERS